MATQAHQKLIKQAYKATEGSDSEVLNQKLSYTHFKNQKNSDAVQHFYDWMQNESIHRINKLPNIGAMIELWDMITVVYNTDSVKSLLLEIKEDHVDHTMWNDFVRKYNLDWETFIY